ncbi:unnamed protein product [Vicia faba]|uniref:Uncharacterized protein n=1 Tax=Vicia faba TaxID=3906 RepID=A0AAV1AGZ7_VICFA|nr:unnamed protein product [Vicia faba]
MPLVISSLSACFRFKFRQDPPQRFFMNFVSMSSIQILTSYSDSSSSSYLHRFEHATHDLRISAVIAISPCSRSQLRRFLRDVEIQKTRENLQKKSFNLKTMMSGLQKVKREFSCAGFMRCAFNRNKFPESLLRKRNTFEFTRKHLHNIIGATTANSKGLEVSA